MAPPATKPTWGTDAGVTTEPSSGKKAAGWVAGEKPPAKWLNYWMNLVYQWIDYYHEKDVANGIVGLGANTQASWTATANNAAGATIVGHGSGQGVAATGGATNGTGLQGTGGATNGTGVSGFGTGTGSGFYGVGGSTSGAGGAFTGGAPNGYGVGGFGDGTGQGGYFVGGDSSGSGILATGGASNGNGVLAYGDGTGAGVGATGGDSSGVGVDGYGGASNGIGVRGTGDGTGAGVYATGGDSSGVGVDGYGGTSNGIGVRGTGAGTGVGGYFDGAGTGTGASDDAVQVAQNIYFSGSDPAATTGFTNRLTPMNLPKSWGNLTTATSGSGGTTNAGFNIASLSRQATGQHRVTFGSAMANTNYAPLLIGEINDPTYWVRVVTRNASYFDFVIYSAGGVAAIDVGATFHFVVFGEQ